MRSLRWRNACVFLVAFAAVPAMAIVVVDEDFEDDIASSYDPLNSLEPGLEGLPTNVKAGPVAPQPIRPTAVVQ